MKKQLKKLHRSHKKPAWNAHRIKRTPFIFASFFGLVMMTYGLSHLLAAPKPVIFTMSPATQTASVAQTKTVILQINPNGETVNGGSVRVTFDANRLTFNKFTVASGSPYNLYSQTSGTGVYSFSFFTYYGTTQSSSLGTLEFQIKPVASTTQTNLAYTGGTSTRAYEGSIFNPDYYASQLSGAAITINVPVTPPPPTPPPVTPPPTPTPPSPNPSPPGTPPPPPSTPGTQTNNNTTQTPTQPGAQTPPPSGGNTPASDDTEATLPGDNSSASDTDDTSNQESETVATANTKKKVPVGAILAVVGGGLVLVAAAFGYATLRRRHGALKKADNVHEGLFDGETKPGKPKHPAPLSPHAHPLETGAAAIAGASAAPAASHEKPTPPPPPVAHKAPVPPQAPPPPPQPAAKPAPVPAAPNNSPEPHQPPVATQQLPAANIPLAMPAWQAEIAARQHVEKPEEPEDMFELAAEHPESYGSTQLLDAEQAKQHPPKGPTAK